MEIEISCSEAKVSEVIRHCEETISITIKKQETVVDYEIDLRYREEVDDDGKERRIFSDFMWDDHGRYAQFSYLIADIELNIERMWDSFERDIVFDPIQLKEIVKEIDAKIHALIEEKNIEGMDD